MNVSQYKGLIDRYRQYLPVTDATPIVSLYEGNTPLIPLHNLSKKIGHGVTVYVKYEGLNPTGSFKDRGMTMAITKAHEAGKKAVICASTGNTSAAAAAYASKAGMKCIVIIPDGNIAMGKLAQALIHGALVMPIKGNFDDALDMVRELGDTYPVQIVNSINPYRIEGQKTAAFELVDTLGDAPDYLFIPVGNAGNISAYWKGFKEYHSIGKSAKLPVICGYQAAGAAPFVKGAPVKDPETIATAIRIGNPASWDTAIAARDESKGLIDAVTDDEIIEAYKLLAACEGVFVEPASAASIAGLIKQTRVGGPITKDSSPKTVVCVVTGHGLKDPKTAISNVKTMDAIEAKAELVAKAAGLV
jgi:threonine synthase